MTSCTPSGSDRSAASPPSTAYQLFDPGIQRWISRLRLGTAAGGPGTGRGSDPGRRPDVVLAAATASGKSEAAWLPICSALVRRVELGRNRPGVQAVVVSPLKALINDQYERLAMLCERLDLPVHRWHGDVPGAASRWCCGPRRGCC